MEILFMTESLDVGGIEINIARLVKELTDREHNVSVAARSGVLSSQISSAGAKTINLKMSFTSPKVIFDDIKKIRDTISKKTEIVHVFSAKSGLLLWVANRTIMRKNRPIVIASLMGILNKTEKENFLITSMRAKLTLIGATKIISTSPEIQKLINKVRNRKQKTIAASVVGVDIYDQPSNEEITALKKTLGIETSSKVITTVGRLAESKSHHLFIKAAKQVIERFPDSQFLIVGDGPLKNDLQELIDTENIAKNVRLIGERHDVKELLFATDVYVRPGIVEGFVGITVLEAQSAQKPVVGFETQDLKVAVTDGVSGLLVPVNNYEKLSNAICKLLDDSEFAEKIAKAGNAQFLKLFSISAIVDNLCLIYDEAKNES